LGCWIETLRSLRKKLFTFTAQQQNHNPPSPLCPARSPHSATSNPPLLSHTTSVPSQNNHPCNSPTKTEPQWLSLRRVTPQPLVPHPIPTFHHLKTTSPLSYNPIPTSKQPPPQFANENRALAAWFSLGYPQPPSPLYPA